MQITYLLFLRRLDDLHTLELAPRSMYVMQGTVRWQWQHSIPPAKTMRYSITFRTKVSRA